MQPTTFRRGVAALTSLCLGLASPAWAQTSLVDHGSQYGAADTAPQARLSLRIPLGGEARADDSRYAPRLQLGVQSGTERLPGGDIDWARRDAPPRTTSLGFTLQGDDSLWLMNDAPVLLETGEAAHVSDGVKIGAGVVLGVVVTGAAVLWLLGEAYADDEG